ncbi:MAG: hypothetical protein KDJ65_17665 [Anaerolineae bacterium]|nr:hypothetical protein [Anaerolineae bacterium]
MGPFINISKIQRTSFQFASAKGIRIAWFNMLKRRSNSLLSFREVRALLGLYRKHDRGLQYVELDSIVGSVGREQDFSRDFYPKYEHLKARWESVNQLFHQSGFQPVELYKVGNVYFVLDGHHRVSVSRAYDTGFVEAYVTEYPCRIDVDTHDDLKSIANKLNRTRTPSGTFALSP